MTPYCAMKRPLISSVLFLPSSDTLFDDFEHRISVDAKCSGDFGVLHPSFMKCLYRSLLIHTQHMIDSRFLTSFRCYHHYLSLHIFMFNLCTF